MRAGKAFGFFTLVGAMTFLGATGALAKSNFPSLIPNGISASCLNCHNDTSGGADNLNVMGNDVQANLSEGVPDWSALYKLDSDGDGASNGLELGDPCGTWDGTIGNEDRQDDISNPGDSAETTSATAPDCGDGGNGGDGNGDEPGGCFGNQVGAMALPSALSLFGLAALIFFRRRRR
jgi:hypothetical protein